MTPRSPLTAIQVLILCAILGLLAACGDQPRKPLRAANNSATAPDFSGAWEMNYGKSDNIQAELSAMVREMRREAERRAQGRGDARSGGYSVGPGVNSGNSVIGLARMAEYITDSQLLDIIQSPTDIQVKREENFALSCEFHGGTAQEIKNPLGQEVCGWDNHQLVFWILLPEGLKINHRLSLGPDGERLNIATTVFSDRVSYPFTVNRVYDRYEPGSEGFSCEMTLTRGKVCTTESR